jgi:hypothetical protein
MEEKEKKEAKHWVWETCWQETQMDETADTET